MTCIIDPPWERALSRPGVLVARAAAPLALATDWNPALARPTPAASPVIAAGDAAGVAANAYPRTLSQEQKQSGPFAWTDSGQMQRWSNVPNGAVRRVGSTWGDLSAPRQTALLQAPQTTLSSPTCFRVTAPALVIEDSPQACQPGGGTPSTPHIHGVHRGPADDYRAKYSGLRTAS